MRFDDFNPKTEREAMSEIHEKLDALMDAYVMFEGDEHNNGITPPDMWWGRYIDSVNDAMMENDWPFNATRIAMQSAGSTTDLAHVIFNSWTGSLPLPNEAEALAEGGYEEEAAMMSFEDPGVDVGTQYTGDIPASVIGFLIDHSGINTNDLAKTFGVSRATLNNRRAGKGRGGISAEQYGGVADEMIEAVNRAVEYAQIDMDAIVIKPAE